MLTSSNAETNKISEKEIQNKRRAYQPFIVVKHADDRKKSPKLHMEV